MNTSAFKPQHYRELIFCTLVGLIIATVFGSTIYADFVQWDDDINIYRNPSIQGLTPANLHWMFTDAQYVRRYMPLGWLSWAIDFECYGMNPAGFHLGNLLWHYLNTILVFVVLRRLFKRGRIAGGDDAAFFSAAAGALIWAFHPLRVEPVAWASGRIYCQATCLLLISLYGYLKFTEEAGPHRRRWYGVALVAYACSLLTYPIGLGLLPVLVVLDRYALTRFGPGWAGWYDARARKIWLEKIPFVAVAAAMFGLTLWCRIHSTGIWRPPVTLEQFGIHARIMQACYVWGCYLWKTWLPFDLAPLYVTLVNFDPYAPLFLINAFLVVGLTAGLFWQRRRYPAAWAFWLCYLVLLVPMLGFTEHPHYPSDRYSYVAGIPYAAAIALLLHHWIFAPKKTTPDAREVQAISSTRFKCPHPGRLSAGAILLVVFSVFSFAQCKIWQTSDTMFVYVIKTLGQDPRRADVYHRLGTYRLSVGNYALAEEVFRQGIAIQPRNLALQAQLGHALALQDKLLEAVAIYESLISQRPKHRETRLNLANALARLDRRAEAETHYKTLLARSEADAEAHLGYAQFLAGGGRLAEAIAEFQEAKRLRPDLDLVYTELGRVLLQQGNTDQAIAMLREALERWPNAAAPLVGLAWIYATHENSTFRNAREAVALADRANALTGGGHPRVLDTLAAAYAEAERYPEAVKVADLALRAAAGSARETAIRERRNLYARGRPYREATALH